jgi:NAD(P)-dependent dehydrogenase (short-subunit alcohol dehydrogenase family)
MGAGQSGFGGSSTAEQVARDISLAGKNVIITGGNTGIGKETARVVAKMGANVIIACRDEKRGLEAEAEVKRTSGNANVRYMNLDLASFSSVRAFASEYKKLGIPLHILINNAGIMGCPYSKTKDGFEMQFGTNHLGHFLLTNLLVPELKAGAPSRVVNVSSKAHTMVSYFNLDTIGDESKYGKWTAYGISKSANILFASEFNRRFSKDGIFSNSLHPGVIATELTRHMTGGSVFHFFAAPFEKSIEQGAATTVYVATAPELNNVGGKFYSDCNEAVPKAHCLDMSFAEKLWEKSEEWTGLKAKSNL